MLIEISVETELYNVILEDRRDGSKWTLEPEPDLEHGDVITPNGEGNGVWPK